MDVQINNAASPTENQTQRIERQQVADEIAVPVAVGQNSAIDSASEAEENRAVLEATVSDINDFVQNIQRNLQFSVAESSGRTVIEVYDSQTEELIRTIPAEEAQSLSAAVVQQSTEGILLKINV
jgi:flagellar protein FlaG